MILLELRESDKTNHGSARRRKHENEFAGVVTAFDGSREKRTLDPGALIGCTAQAHAPLATNCRPPWPFGAPWRILSIVRSNRGCLLSLTTDHALRTQPFGGQRLADKA